MWLICGTTLGRGKNKLLVRGTEGAEWIFCPIVKSSKGGRVSTNSCQGCRHFIRFEQTYIPQTHIMKKTFFIKTTSPKETFHVARTLNRSRATHPSFARARLLPHMPSLTEKKPPLVDIFEEGDYLRVLAELPSIDEKDISIETDGSTITITAENETKKYLKIVRLPTHIKKGPIEFTHKNNILQVRLKKLCDAKDT
jgi:HSP20 family molecular chaperone IbpA